MSKRETESTRRAASARANEAGLNARGLFQDPERRRQVAKLLALAAKGRLRSRRAIADALVHRKGR
jgi:hypothetical protein